MCPECGSVNYFFEGVYGCVSCSSDVEKCDMIFEVGGEEDYEDD